MWPVIWNWITIRISANSFVYVACRLRFQDVASCPHCLFNYVRHGLSNDLFIIWWIFALYIVITNKSIFKIVGHCQEIMLYVLCFTILLYFKQHYALLKNSGSHIAPFSFCTCSRVPLQRGTIYHDNTYGTVLQWLPENINKTSNSQQTPHTPPCGRAMGCLLW